MRSNEPPPNVSLWYIVAAEQNTVADPVERLVGRTDGYVVQDNAIARPSRSGHVPKTADTCEGRFHQMCPTRA